MYAVVALDRIDSLSQRILSLKRNLDSEKSLVDSAEQKVSFTFVRMVCAVYYMYVHCFCFLVPDAM